MRHLFTFLLLLDSILSQGQVAVSKEFFFGSGHHDTDGALSVNFYQSSQMDRYDVKYVKIDIAVEPPSAFISGVCFYEVEVTQPLDTFSIEFKDNMLLDSVYISKTRRIFTRSSDHIDIAVAPAVSPGTRLSIVFYYRGTPERGIFTGSNVATGLAYTANVSESFQARNWFPAKQVLTDKIDSSDVWITTSTINLAGSNGRLRNVVALPGNKRQFQWASRYPIDYYLVSFAAANYREYRNYAKPVFYSPDSIPVLHYVGNDTAYFNSIKGQLDKTPAFLEKMSELFGPYPFAKEKYGHAQAFIGGGMEHQTMSTMQAFDDQLVAHELAHQWFGDNVTCAAWNDIWLNESFATYGHILMLEKLPALFLISASDQMEAVHQHIMSLPGGSVYVPLQEAFNERRIFDGRLSYNKGAAIIHNLRFEMQNDTLFFNALKTYQQKFKHSVAGTNDFKQIAEQVSGKDFTNFFNQWIFGEGYPEFSVVYYKQGKDTLVLSVSQTTSVPSVTPLFKGLMEYQIKSAGGDTIVKFNQLVNAQTFKFRYSKTPAGVEVDPNNWVLNKVGLISAGTDILNPGQGEVSLFPNPVRDVIEISISSHSFSVIRVFDVEGRLLYSSVIPANQTRITLRHPFPRGTYYIHMYGKEKSVTRKVLVIK